MKSKYKMGWIGIRASKLGQAGRLLKNQGWIKITSDNRNALNWARPVRTNEQFMATDWSQIANAGLEGTAFWLSDAQWGANAGITDKQWQQRAIIG